MACIEIFNIFFFLVIYKLYWKNKECNLACEENFSLY